MRCARTGILDVMAVDVRIRVPNDVYRALTAKAAQVGQSLAEFLGAELAKVAGPAPYPADPVRATEVAP
jgi:hypothetical protein